MAFVKDSPARNKKTTTALVPHSLLIAGNNHFNRRQLPAIKAYLFRPLEGPREVFVLGHNTYKSHGF